MSYSVNAWLLVLGCVTVWYCQAVDHSTDLEWKLWTRRFDKSYATQAEESLRKTTWLHNRALVLEHNNRPGVTFRMGLNSLADQSAANRSRIQLPWARDNRIPISGRNSHAPAEFDWRKKGVVLPVIDQGQIGSVLAYVTRDAVSSYGAIHMGSLFNLSVRRSLTAAETAMLGPVFECVHKIGGLCLAQDYNTSDCQRPTCKQVGQVDGGRTVTSGDEADLQMAVLKTPVLVAIDASQVSFQMYQAGIYDDPNCSPTRLDHALLLVGYGKDSSGNEYWICKNSWGKAWGMQGYVYMSRNKRNQCGIASAATYPV
ncbi:procathepsin L-like [Liolophura sinensis]|uniref:procathepsin L-like n=1 Tax=Liolophura sinensis TaxID=3198878 RepID=UPI003158BD89